MESKSERASGIPIDSDHQNEGIESGDFLPAYELLDFGDGRKLERFAGKVLDRPAPAAKGLKRQRRDDWKLADHVYQEKPGQIWSPEETPADWLFRWKTVLMELRLSPFGHVGLFPEQIANWRWLEGFAGISSSENPVRVLNLFGYTGGSTLAMAAAGCHVTHVDASRPTIQWGKRNAHRSGLESASIRWIVDDVRDYVRRASRRGECYEAILMDPPAYGHGADGQSWDLSRDLDDLIAGSLNLMSSKPSVFLLTGHSPIPSLEQGPMSGDSWDRLKSKFGQHSKHRVSLADSNHRRLDFGYAYRFWS